MKSLNGIFKAIFEIGKWLSKMMYLHLLWVIFSLMGLVVFGVMPATTAMFTVIRKWMEDDNDIPVFQTFLASYKTHFLKSNALGTFLVAIGIFLYIDMKISKQLVQSFYLHIILHIIGFLYLITLLYFFPVFVRYKLKYSQNFKQSFYIALARPFETIAMIISLILLYYLFNFLPILLIFVGSSLIAYSLMWFASQAFKQIEGKKAT